MYFSVNTLTQKIAVHKNLGSAARHALSELGEPNKAIDPVAALNAVNINNTFILQNASDAFEAISQSDNTAAQELAASYKQALDAFYKD